MFEDLSPKFKMFEIFQRDRNTTRGYIIKRKGGGVMSYNVLICSE